MYQNSAVFRAKTEHLRALPSHVELVYLDGPVNLVPKVVTKPIDTAAFRAWWDPAQGPDGQSRALQYIGDAIHKEPRLDGVLGFSQGACLASWLCSAIAQDKLDWSPEVAILLGGYIDPNDAIFADGLAPHVRSFHAYGLNDRVVPAAKSERLAALFERGTHPELVSRHTHAQGHIVPKCDGALMALQSFLHEPPSTSDEDELHHPRQTIAAASNL
ncbi:Aste57867_2758 [Aphanomyces stellatus]|uniref:Aste57867_2758 protein n=1 Tax=Aphanomyces stellatus TaxID=120398 RepID=A0A485K8B0_9STRA|nr:hypothetical protein As57867_002751 [Aphanomyces stellatus]VFT79950.1 Aste57867_2758 [Aphanomyces stellatus]